MRYYTCQKNYKIFLIYIYMARSLYCKFFLFPSLQRLATLCQDYSTLGKGNNQTFGRFLDTGCEMITKSWKQNKPLLSVYQSRGLLRLNGYWYFGSGPSHSICSWALNSPYGYFPSSRMLDWKRHTQQMVESLYWLSDEWGQLEDTRTASQFQNSKSKIILHSWRNCRD